MSFDLTREDFERFTAQQRSVFLRLTQGPATNRELSEICFGYRQRVSDLRRAGQNIECERVKGGLTVYRLVPMAPPKKAEQVDLFKPAELRNF